MDRVMLLVNFTFVICLLLAYASTWIRPESAWLLAFFGMAYPVFLLSNLVFAFYWLFKKRFWSLLSIGAILFGWSHLNTFFGVNRTGSATDGAQHIKVMSYNVRLFDLYNWSSNKLTRNKIFDLLLEQDADIMCFQEFYHFPNKKDFVTKDTIVEHFRQHYCHDDYVQKTKLGHKFGIATFSAYPIIGKGRIVFENDINNICIWSDIKINEDTIRVYNAHLASIGFHDSDYEFYSELNIEMEQSEIEKGSRKIGRLLKRAFIKRAAQVEKIAAHMDGSPHPMIYCGDLNDTPVSYSYNVLTARLSDAFFESGFGFGGTYIGDLPSYRIDHIMHSDDLRSYGFKTLPDELSDHRPVTCFVEW